MNLTTGVRVTLRQPTPPRVTVTQPASPRIVLVPVRGPVGPQGAAGSGTGATVHAHHQINPAATWTITHNLGSHNMPTVLLDDEPTRPVVPDVDVVDANQQVLTFPTPVTGWAYITN